MLDPAIPGNNTVFPVHLKTAHEVSFLSGYSTSYGHPYTPNKKASPGKIRPQSAYPVTQGDQNQMQQNHFQRENVQVRADILETEQKNEKLHLLNKTLQQMISEKNSEILEMEKKFIN